MHNPCGELLKRANPVAQARRRLDIFAEKLQLPRERLAGWTCAMAVVCAIWAIEDGQLSGYDIDVARMLDAATKGAV
jgi:streptomycin 6-kinase